MKSNPARWVIGGLVAVVLLSGAFSSGFIAGRLLPQADPHAGLQLPVDVAVPTPAISPQEVGTPEELQELFVPFWQAWGLVQDTYVEQPIDDVVLLRGAIRGMLAAVGDPHTSYLDPVEFEQANAHLSGEYEGIGAWVDVTREYLTIISPMKDSPAEKAGLRPEDQIIAVDGVDMTGVDGELVRQKVIGPAGSSVILTILRRGMEEPFDVTIVRAKITVRSVEGEMLEGKIAYVHLVTFGDNTTRELKQVLRELMAQKPSGLILDLRLNGGGYLETAIEVASQFIGDGVLMYEEYADGSRTTYQAQPGGLATEIPLVVLIDQGSASASEIVAGAIRDRQRGVLVGMTSYGKGSVQTYTPLLNDQGAVRITIARWLTPNGLQINDIGLNPDYTIEMTEEDMQADRDPQLEKAIELLSEK